MYKRQVFGKVISFLPISTAWQFYCHELNWQNPPDLVAHKELVTRRWTVSDRQSGVAIGYVNEATRNDAVAEVKSKFKEMTEVGFWGGISKFYPYTDGKEGAKAPSTNGKLITEETARGIIKHFENAAMHAQEACTALAVRKKDGLDIADETILGYLQLAECMAASALKRLQDAIELSLIHI